MGVGIHKKLHRTSPVSKMRHIHKLIRLSRRIALPLLVLIYFLFILFNLNNKNFYNNQIRHNSETPYQGGFIDDIKIFQCMSLLYGQCNRIIELNETSGLKKEWVKVDKYLDLKGIPSIPDYIDSQNGLSSIWKKLVSSVKRNKRDYLYVHLHEDPTLEVIVDIAIGDPQSDDPPSYVKQRSEAKLGKPKSRIDIESNFINWTKKDNGIWVKYDTVDKAKNTKSLNGQPISDLSYFFGEEGMIEPREGWRFVSGALQKYNRLRLSIYQGQRDTLTNSFSISDLQRSITVQNKSDGFKILQLSDLHFNSNFGDCKDQTDQISYDYCKSDIKTLQFINNALDAETPDLVVITGDLLNGLDLGDYQTSLIKVLSPFIRRKIPYAIALGLEDTHKYTSRKNIIQFIGTLPYSLLTDLKTNYAINIKDSEDKFLSNIYILDLFHKTPNQLELLRSQISPSEVTKLSFLFQHAPIREYRPRGTFGIVGEYNEKDKLPSSLTDPNTIQFIQDYQIKTISVGYEHTNECCIQSATSDGPMGLWMCYSGAAGETSQFGPKSVEKRVRMFRIDWLESIITSWKIRERDLGVEAFDYQYIYNELS